MLAAHELYPLNCSLLAKQTFYLCSWSQKNRSARMLANTRKDHSSPLIKVDYCGYNDAECLFTCYFKSHQAQRLPFLAVLTWFLILGKIQDGGQDGNHCWWRHRPPVAPPPIKYTSACWEYQRLSTEDKILSKYRNLSKFFFKTVIGLQHFLRQYLLLHGEKIETTYITLTWHKKRQNAILSKTLGEESLRDNFLCQSSHLVPMTYYEYELHGMSLRYPPLNAKETIRILPRTSRNSHLKYVFFFVIPYQNKASGSAPGVSSSAGK